MIKVENLSYSFPEKDLYKEISFTLEDGQHCAFIGSNGTGKSTLIHMILKPEEYLYDGKIIKDEDCRIGYVSQFSKADKELDMTSFEFLSEEFVKLQKETEDVCNQMATAEDLEFLLERYQQLLDQSMAIDGDNYESTIKKQLKLAGLEKQENVPVSKLSGGEFKLLQVIKEMLLLPNLLIMDEPDVFLDFENMNGLCDLIHSYKGTMLVVTHNRYLLNHCFNKILHLEDTDIQEFDGSYIDYNFSLLQKKIELQEIAAQQQEEIERYQKMVDRLRDDATKMTSSTRGRALHAKETHLERLEARKIKAPFVDIRQPEIKLPEIPAETKVNMIETNLFKEDVSEVKSVDEKVTETDVVDKKAESEETENAKEIVLRVGDYQVSFDELLLEHVNFELHAGEKVAIVGPNGTGKTTLLREIFKQSNPAIVMSPDVKLGLLSQIHGDTLNESNTIYDEFFELGFETMTEIREYLKGYCFSKETLDRKIEKLSGGEKNLLQLAKLAKSNANLLLLDEPTSHLDTYSQIALEKAIQEYNGAILMVSHDFYNIVNCADYVLYVEDKTIRRMRIRAFRKMIYAHHFDKDYLELEQKKKELETRIELCLKASDFITAKALSEQLENVVEKMER